MSTSLPGSRHVVGNTTAPSAATRWMVAAFAVAFVAAACVLLIVGTKERGIDDALLVTARWSFLLFLPAYVGSATGTLFGRAAAPLKRHTRNFALSFASAHIVHLGLVGWLCVIGAAPPVMSFFVFGIAAIWTYLLAIASISHLQAAMGRRLWRLLSFVGSNYIAAAFAMDFLRFPPEASLKYLVGYLPFAILSIGGPTMRLCAWTSSNS